MHTRSLRLWVIPAALVILRVATALMLSVDAYVHADLAIRYDPNRSASISQGTLFRWEAGAAAFAALAVLVVFWRLTWSLVAWALALVVAASALAAVMIYAHYDVGRLGPLPDMYEPFWYAEKTRAAVAEAIATGTAALGFAITAALVWARSRTRRVAEPRPTAGGQRVPVRARIRHDL
jgi:hypothetical protein